MNFNVWNIKEMLSTPTATGYPVSYKVFLFNSLISAGRKHSQDFNTRSSAFHIFCKPNKFSIRSSAPSDHSSLSDSQLLFGSQFCPENVQLAVAPLDLGPQLPGQHNSQDSEPSIFTKYQTKPQLFDEDTKEKGSFNFGAGRVKSVFENFELNKNKIKDKYDREVLSTFISSIKDRLQELQASLDKFGEMFHSRNQSILEHIETISKTLQDALQSHCGSVLKALADKSQMEQALLEMERRLAAKDVEISDVKSSIHLLKEGLETLPAQLSDQHLKLCEELGFLKLPDTLVELRTFISSARPTPHMTDNSSQTSPGPCQDCGLGKKNGHWPCCQGKRLCSSSGQPQSPHMVSEEQHGDSPMKNQVTGNSIPDGDLNTTSRAKDSPTATAAHGRENTSVWKAKIGSETESCANHPCECCTKSHFLGASQKKHCPISQELPLPTPLRKAVRRGMRGFGTMTPSQHRKPQLCYPSVQKDMPGQIDNNLSTDLEVENAAVGNKPNHRPTRICWNKAMGRKKMCPARKGELSRCADVGRKQRKENRIIELESSRRNSFPRYMVALNLESSDSVFAAPSPQILSSTQSMLTKNFPPVPCSNKSLQQLVDKRKRSLEIKKIASVSSVKRNFWDSSPQENVFSLCSSTVEDQMSSFSFQSPAGSRKPHPVNTLAQQNTACCSLVFDSDYSD